MNASSPIPREIAIPPNVARRLDRLARHAHAFHRFAHHPACDEYADEVLRVGRRTRICRGCALTGLGALVGIGSALLVPASPTLAAASVSVAIGLILASRRVRSIGKFAGRFLPSSLLVLAFVDGLRASSLPGYAVALGTCVSTVLLVRAYRARGPHRGPCHACPERTRAIPCRGYAPIVRRERAFRRRAGILLGSS